MRTSILPFMNEGIKLFCDYHKWLRHSAIQQGIVYVTVFIISLLLISSLTITYVNYHLAKLDYDIGYPIEGFVHSAPTVIDKELIDEEDVINILVTGFSLSGLLVLILNVVIVFFISKRNKNKIDSIELVLKSAVEGEISARTNIKKQDNDLDVIGYSVDEMLSQLQSVMTAMNDISINITNELKTPITRLQCHLLKLDKMINNKKSINRSFALEQLALALKESSSLAEMFNALLRISQIKSGVRQKSFELIDISDVLSTIADIYVAVAVAVDVNMTLSVVLPASPLYIQGDRELLIQQLANLVENSLRYCPEGSELFLFSKKEKENVVLIMKDNGPGISEQERQRVFECLYRINKVCNDSGIGIGLSLVKAVAELHKGEVKLYDCNPGLKVEICYPKL